MPKMISQRYEAEVPLNRLTPHPMNPNEGDIGLLCDLFDQNGFGGAVLAQESTGILIDGETRLHAAEQSGLPSLPVIWLDVDDDTRDRLLAEYNESTRRGQNNEVKLLALLQGLAMTPRGLEGAAFDGDDVDSLMARLGQPLHIGEVSNGGEHSETDEEEAERENRAGGYNDRSAGGSLVEMILVFSTAQREEVGEILTQLRGLRGNAEERAADLILLALRSMVATIEGRPEDAHAIGTS